MKKMIALIFGMIFLLIFISGCFNFETIDRDAVRNNYCFETPLQVNHINASASEFFWSGNYGNHSTICHMKSSEISKLYSEVMNKTMYILELVCEDGFSFNSYEDENRIVYTCTWRK